MHQALLIDEIIQIVLDLCLDFGDGSTLSRASRVCRAWRDPALNRLWHRLIDVTPLLQLIPGLIRVNGVYAFESPAHPDLRALRSYSSRVKHIKTRQSVQLHPSVSSLLSSVGNGLFTRLTTAQLSLTNCHSFCPMLGPSDKLERLDLDLGFKNSILPSTNNAASELLGDLPNLTSLSLRGSASEQVLRAVSAVSNLRTLSLRISTSLDSETILAISAFPFLTGLELHAVHIRSTKLAEKWTARGGAPCFPSLKSLSIRARIALIGTILHHMQSDQLQSLYIDIEPVVQSDDSWTALFNIMKDKTPFLHDFTIDHHVDTDPIGLEDSNANDSNNAPVVPNNATAIDFEDMLRFDLVRPLFKLHDLKRLVFDTTPPIVIRDEDFTQIATHWPKLAHLELGTVPTVDPRWVPQTSLKGLVTLSQKSTTLISLVIPIDMITSVDVVIPKQSHPANALRKITITSLTPPDATLMAKSLDTLFPCLQVIDGTSEHEMEWSDIQAMFQGLRAIQLAVRG
ncbi:hypothetical protein WG66_002834 [Moniliophthora roreri]|uniref:Uncharacterized protein n=1 Tax=Moniliophthora roreri TaxID=221103 RepID=A0A0W0F340_MONRR|nr:hypothetical protein WG66_002834 [Moniliophthora roreri]